MRSVIILFLALSSSAAFGIDCNVEPTDPTEKHVQNRFSTDCEINKPPRGPGRTPPGMPGITRDPATMRETTTTREANALCGFNSGAPSRLGPGGIINGALKPKAATVTRVDGKISNIKCDR